MLSEPFPKSAENFPVAGIGASAGGLDACRKFLDAQPPGAGMAYILVQHLDPSHSSMMAELLATHTALEVVQAQDGARVEPGYVYTIPPGTYLSVADGLLHLSPPEARHGARMPFDHLLKSMAVDFGPRAIAIVLSGTGTDGASGVKAVRVAGGLVIAQEPGEGGYDGMPRSAIATGAVDLVLPVAKIAGALFDRLRGAMPLPGEPARKAGRNSLAEIVDLLRANTSHDFTLYKSGTLQRRTERRMAMGSIESGDMESYLDLLRSDPAEVELLAKDLLINVTSFFRDSKVFDLLAEKTIPELVRDQPSDKPLRIWVAGCSTGEETYSIAILFREAIAAAKRHLKLQIFASDVDADAVAAAREGLYPETIAADVSPARLERFFAREDHSWRVLPDLRASVVFAVQDVLADPPFSRLDMVSCRNLMIYLRTEAQAKVLAVFHFALREGGFLLLGSSETTGAAEHYFEIISKPDRLYRHVGSSRPGELPMPMGVHASRQARGMDAPPARPAPLADLCARMLLKTYAPAAVLINRKLECLYFSGATDVYLKVAAGHALHNVLTMAREGVRAKLRSAIHQAISENGQVVVAGGRLKHNGGTHAFAIAVQPVPDEGQRLLLVCFIDQPAHINVALRPAATGELPRVDELEHELVATRAELQGAIHDLDIANEEHKAINEEALSVNEEFQSTNEELLTSKEELQSLNEELTALNSQLQETLECQRTTSNDLQNILYSTDIATLFLDMDLNIRFFTPATKELFPIISSDVGRPLADFRPLAADEAMLDDAREVIRTLAPIEREIETGGAQWFRRRILAYRTPESGVEGVVITFNNITERRKVSDALESAQREADLANIAKSRFLAAASHDLRQPLQTMTLIQGLLAKRVEGEKARMLVARLDETLGSMSGMLNTLLDINKIEAGTVRAEMASFPVGELLARLHHEFAYQAASQKLVLRMVPCSLTVRTDPNLLEQMVRNLLSNALKYTRRGKILLGCRRSGKMLRIEIWDTGIGIAQGELRAIFDEYHQLDNAARERSRGLGLGLSIVKRLGDLMGHRVRVRSREGRGSGFSVEVEVADTIALSKAEPPPVAAAEAKATSAAGRAGTILIVEDDPEISSLLELLLQGEGYRTATAPHGSAALDLVAHGRFTPDIVLADYNLPGGMDGLATAGKLRGLLGSRLPVVILTGDISTGTLRDIALLDCVHRNKPVRPVELLQTIQHLMPNSPLDTGAKAAEASEAPSIFIVDDDDQLRATLRYVFEEEGSIVADYRSCEAFLEAYRPGGEACRPGAEVGRPGRAACLLIDAYLPGMDGLDLLRQLRDAGDRLPAIMITGRSDVGIAVKAMKAGAFDFIEKPIGNAELIASVGRALDQARDAGIMQAWRNASATSVAGLTLRQRQIMDLVVAGHPSKNIAADLGISQRTVENHRAAIMQKTGLKTLPALVRLALAATPV